MSTIPHITCEHFLEIHRSKEKEHIIVDIRDNAEFDAGHLRDSLHVPHHELATNIETLVPEKTRRVIVIIGPTQEKEIEAVHVKLVELGYTNVEFLAGGFDQFCEIAPVELEPDLIELTPEESGAVGRGQDEEDLDPHTQDNQPLL